MPRSSLDSLTSAIERLTGEVVSLRDVMEEFRVCFEWAVNNDRLRGAESDDVPELKAIVFDLRDKLTLVANVVEAMQGGGSEVGRAEQRSLFPTDAEGGGKTSARAGGGRKLPGR